MLSVHPEMGNAIVKESITWAIILTSDSSFPGLPSSPIPTYLPPFSAVKTSFL